MNRAVAQVLDGRALSASMRDDIKLAIDCHLQGAGQASALPKRLPRRLAPGLAVILVGDDPASAVYVRNKRLACEQTGIRSKSLHFPASVTTAELVQAVQQLNHDDSMDGILVQLPLPSQVCEQAVLECIDVGKDVDGFNAMNIGRLVLRDRGIRPCTPRGVMALLHHHGISTRGMHAVVVGASNIVGRPMALELLLDGATITVCHRFTRNLEHHVRQAEILVTAVGKTGIVDANWLRDGAVVVDIAMNRDANGQLCGDLDAEIVRRKASWYTPVPGGVGPMTVTMLLLNTIQAAGIAMHTT
ncbi:MAG: bifunctional methylenetetrahydrofolate dehydrogenase/methenyltetrahydrofolate cyclohydrolase FolD [Gammaproteobacteria bacterium]|jgi:methylenetetrahydrofolate dehydrogenase (NADP+)/methenyltetrahydrofolate cyclohydrolase|nr:bifunctional methylenetetrahydrofolate dehydrogenase/methenyltetrahydrofolate cyclohydrolase FolD [Gammaproteobacteria bacterium]